MDNQSQPALNMDVAPALKLYLESIESWKENYMKLLESANFQPAKSQNPVAENYNQTLSDWQSVCGEMYKRFVDDQVELCRFFSHRWAGYRDLPQQVSDCRNPTELAQLQIDFMTRMMTEYTRESMKLIQPVSDLMAKYSTGRPIY